MPWGNWIFPWSWAPCWSPPSFLSSPGCCRTCYMDSWIRASGGLFDAHFPDHRFAQRLIDTLDDFLFLEQEFLPERGNGRMDVEGMTVDRDLVRIAGDGLSHDLLPYVVDLQCLY